MRRQQAVLAHQPGYPFARDPDPVHHPQPRPHLAMSLAVPGRTGEIGADRRQQGVVGHLWASVRDAASELASSCRPGAGRHRRTIAARPRCGRPRRCRSGGRCSGTLSPPSPRPPAGQRDGAFDARTQQFDLHAQFADPLHGRGELASRHVRLAFLDAPSSAASAFCRQRSSL